MTDLITCSGCPTELTDEMRFCPECGTPRPLRDTASSRLRGSLVRLGGPADGRGGQSSPGPSSRLRAPSWLFDPPERPLAVDEPVVDDQPVVVPDPVPVAFGYELVETGVASTALALELVDDATVRLPHGEPVRQRYLLTASAWDAGRPVIIDSPGRAVLTPTRLVAVLRAAASADGAGPETEHLCISLDLAAVHRITLERRSKRLGGFRDVAVRLATGLVAIAADGLELRLLSPAVEVIGPATYGPPPEPVPPSALFEELVTAATDHDGVEAVPAAPTPVGDDLVVDLRPPPRDPEAG